MFETPIDLARLKHDLRALAAQSKALKALLRQRWTRPMADEQRALAALRRRATRLCVLRASLRGRLHLHIDVAEHQKIAARAAREYVLEGASCSTSSSTSA